MVIDAHQHVFWHGRDDAALVADLDANGIDQCWLLTWEIPPAYAYADNAAYSGLLNPARARSDGTHPGIPLEDLLVARDRHPDRFVLGYCPDPASPDAPALLQAAATMHGVRVCGEWKFRMLVDDPRCLELFRAAGRLGLPVVVHLDVPYLPDAEGRPVYQPLWYGGTLANLERAVEACPQTTFIGHAPGFWREISGEADADAAVYPQGTVRPGGRLAGAFERYPNLYADISAGSGLRALQRDPAHGREFVVRYADRLLFGRDYVGGEHQAFLATLELPAKASERILGGNAERLLERSAAAPAILALGLERAGAAAAGD